VNKEKYTDMVCRLMDAVRRKRLLKVYAAAHQFFWSRIS